MVSLATAVLRRLTSPFDADDYLALANPLWGTRLRGRIESVTPLTPSSAALRIRPGATWLGHRPGQFVTLGVDVDGVRHHRCYSLTSLPWGPTTARGDRTIEIAVQATPGGAVSNHLVHHARPGDVVQLSQASGDFTLAAATPTVLFVTGGSGITPVIGMLRELEASTDPVDAVLLHHTPDVDRLMYAAELDRLGGTDGIRVDIGLTRPEGRSAGLRLDAARLDRTCADWRERDTYLCGPQTLIDTAVEIWADAGLAERLHVERFVPAGLAPRADHDGAGTSIARFAASDVDTLADPSTPLLDIAEGAGLSPPSGCRMGICHTCTTRLDHGCVRDLRDGRIHEAGQHVQLCVSAAIDDVVLDR